MDKVIRDGKVAVLYSPGYGAGWYTWGDLPDDALFDPDMVEAVLAEDYARAEAISKRKWPDAYTGGIKQMEVEWVPIGTAFRLTEYDGYERVEFYDPSNFITA